MTRDSRLPIAAEETARLVSLSATGLFGISKDYVFECITNIGAQLFNAPVCSLLLADAEKNWFNSCAAPDVREIFRHASFREVVVADSEPMVVEDTFLDVRPAGDLLLRVAPQIRFFAGHPIRGSSGAVLGTLCVLDFTPRDFPPERRRLLEELVFLAELCLVTRGITTAQKALVAKLDLARHESLIDPLLRIWNRGGITTILNQQYESSRELLVPFSILMADIDHFKKINDRHGHIAGDTVLKAVTGVLQAAMRVDDELGRYGGEEFIAILPNTNAANAEELARRLNESVAKLTVDTPTGSVGCTVSIGVAEWSPSRMESVQALVHRADAALLSAKQRGRNRVRLSPRAA
jgi:diguanylate cyclase (GGDEF)-like protein